MAATKQFKKSSKGKVISPEVLEVFDVVSRLTKLDTLDTLDAHYGDVYDQTDENGTIVFKYVDGETTLEAIRGRSTQVKTIIKNKVGTLILPREVQLFVYDENLGGYSYFKYSAANAHSEEFKKFEEYVTQPFKEHLDRITAAQLAQEAETQLPSECQSFSY